MPRKFQDINAIAHLLIKQHVIQLRVDDLAEKMNQDPREDITVFWVANGALAFLNMLWRASGLFTRKEMFIEAIRARSYGADLRPGAVSSDADKIDFSLHSTRRIILLEDLMVSGATINSIATTVNNATKQKPGLEIVTLFQKIDCKKYDVQLAHCGFTLTGNPWLIGVGLDHFNYYRTQPSLWMLKKEFLPPEYPKEDRDLYPEHPRDVCIKVDGEPIAEWYMRANESNSNRH